MAPFIPFPGGIQANIRFTLHGIPGEYVLNFDISDGPFSEGSEAIFNALDATWWPTIRGAIGTGFLLTELYCVDLSDQFGPTRSFTDWDNPAPGSTNPALPGNVAFAVCHRTEKRGRAYRGRTYVAGLNEAAVVGNTVQLSDRTACVGAFNLLRAELGGFGILFAIASRQENKVARTTGVLTPVTQSVAVDNETDSQRRRLT